MADGVCRALLPRKQDSFDTRAHLSLAQLRFHPRRLAKTDIEEIFEYGARLADMATGSVRLIILCHTLFYPHNEGSDYTRYYTTHGHWLGAPHYTMSYSILPS
jgi:hypothetical protein